MKAVGPLLLLLTTSAALAGDAPAPRIVAHRGLFKHAPENTVAAFAACLDLRLGFELDVRRTRDGHLVCLHDPDVKRTTDGRGAVTNLTLAEVRRLDAGAWFDPAFAGGRVPTLDEAFALLAARADGATLVAIDIKAEDEQVEADIVRLAKKHGVMGRLVCIGRAIDDPAVRRRLRTAGAKTPVAVLAQRADDLPAALKAADADWVYLRFLPTAGPVAAAHRAGKRVFVVGKLFAGHEPANWRAARAAGVDALLTDYPLECRQAWREKK
jgi:glycerophosphoryl diester phosphodiesterase